MFARFLSFSTILLTVAWVFRIVSPAEEIRPSGSGPAISVTENVLPSHTTRPERNLIDQTRSQARAKSTGCLECHQGSEDMHKSAAVVLGCTDCHGGDPQPGLTKEAAHVAPLNPEFWKTSANPPNANVVLNHESPEFIQFINPGDLRVARQACGLCHSEIIEKVETSMMTHGAMLWGAALYNNGADPHKNYVFGQAYSPHGVPLVLRNPNVTPEMTAQNGILPSIYPLPRFNLSQPGNILRIFEKGGEKQLQLGSPTNNEPPGRPLRRLSERGLGTLNRTDPVFLGLQKTRLNDPLLSFMGSNDHPGDYRSSGCTACHVVYANDRSPINSGWYAKYGHQGLSFSADPSIPKNERGHPIMHQFTRAIPSSQCMNCHMHQGNAFVNPYLGYTWWDQETDGELMYPKKQKDPTDSEMVQAVRKNPEAAAARGLWGDLNFLEKVSELNPKLQHTQFADYHGHGWIFRAIFKKDRVGTLLDANDQKIGFDDPKKFQKAVHLNDIHLAKGMQCVDCHFDTDIHGNGNLYGEVRNAVSIECIDCHGTAAARPTLITSGNAGKINLLTTSNTPWGPRFFWRGEKLFQRSTMSPDIQWEIDQTLDTINPLSEHYNAKSRYAKTLLRDGKSWGTIPGTESVRRSHLAHDESAITCQVCHSSWATSCFGCHLPMKANVKMPLNKFEGVTDRNFTTYNPQVVRDDVFMLGVDSTVKKNRLAVLRSSSAIVVGSQNANREWVYSQQQTVSAEGYSGQAFNPHFPHTTSGVGTTKNCTDCHLSAQNDNNAIMTQLLGFGTGTVNFFGRYAYVGEGKGGFDAVVWTEQEEPQAALGSHLQKLAYPDNYQQHVQKNKEALQESHHHHGDEILDLTLRGEYLYTANGPGGFEVFDVANIDNKGFSERIISTPVSPLGQRTQVPSRYATSVTLPSTLGIDPLRERRPENEEQPISLIYGYVYVTDRYEGLITVLVGTLVDGNPDNNFLNEKDVTRFNPNGELSGATHSFMAGHYLYLTCTNGLYVIDIQTPSKPIIVGKLTGNFLKNPRAVAVQFHYAFITDDEGLKICDITDPIHPVAIPGATMSLANAGRLYVARTYAYVPNGAEGLAIIDIENPANPRLIETFNAGGQMNDTRALQIGSINASMYALVADGKNGLRVLQMISPDTVPGAAGFSPRPAPKLIATWPVRHGEVVAVSRGLDRDRVVDETGNQTVVFGRRGSRPFNYREMLAFLRHYGDPYAVDRHSERRGPFYKVSDIAIKSGVLQTTTGEKLPPPLTAPPVDNRPAFELPNTLPTRIPMRPGGLASPDQN